MRSPKKSGAFNREKEWSMPHGVWSEEEVNSIKVGYAEPSDGGWFGVESWQEDMEISRPEWYNLS